MSEMRESAVAKLSFGQERESGAHREDLFRQAQVYATLAVADEIAALRESVEAARTVFVAVRSDEAHDLPLAPVESEEA